MGGSRDILAMLSVQTPGGLVFGTARRIEALTLGFELEGRLEAGDEVEFRMELPGLEDTAMGRLRVVAGRKDPATGASAWSGSILKVAAEDAEVFEVWRRGVEQGTRSFSHTTRSGTDSWMSSTTMVGSTDAERKLAVAAQEERRRRRLERAKTLAHNAKTWPDPVDREAGRSVASGAFRPLLSGAVSRSVAVSIAPGEAGAGRPREQIAAALRGKMASEGAEAPIQAAPASHPSVAPAPPPRGPVAAPAAPVAGSAPPGTVSRPVVFVDRSMLSLSFTDAEAWRRHDRGAILAGALRVAHPGLGREGALLQAWLRLPSGTTVGAEVSVGAGGPGWTELRFALPPAARKMVELG